MTTKKTHITNPTELYLAVMAAGFCGACLRYLCSNIPAPALGGFPLVTLLINVVGSYCIFVVFQHAGRRWHLTAHTIKIINTGFLGAFTTLSAMCTETITLVRAGSAGLALLYVFLTFVLTFVAVLLAIKTCDGLALLRMKRLQAHREKHRQALNSSAPSAGEEAGE